MVKVDTSVLINQPIEKVFDFVTTPENDAQWYIGVESRDHTPGEPAGVADVESERHGRSSSDLRESNGRATACPEMGLPLFSDT